MRRSRVGSENGHFPGDRVRPHRLSGERSGLARTGAVVDAAVAPAAPDYSKPEAWAALPDRKDDADVAPEGEVDQQDTAPVDVFFIHPTTYYDDDHWNQPLDDEGANKRTYEDNSGKTFHCTNPLSWSTGKGVATAKEHVGAVKFGDDLTPSIDRNYVESARCDQALFVELPNRKYPRLGKNLHLVDYGLFYMDIRKNAVERSTAFLNSEK